jgi:hypothetical protein
MAWPIGCLDDERSKHVLIERAAYGDLAACERLIKAFWVLIGMVARIYDGLPSVDRTALRQNGVATCPGPCAALTPTEQHRQTAPAHPDLAVANEAIRHAPTVRPIRPVIRGGKG